jgi:oxygen-independent coproporphyrinogen III oxidase
MAGIYFHIPFCKQACYYCDFHFSTNVSYKDEMVQALGRELNLQREYITAPVDTIYFGGGTPSLLTENELDFLLNEVNKNFHVNPAAEITLEANPDDLTGEKIKGLRHIGINRLSIGIQSFDDVTLKYLNRAHTAVSAEECVALSQESGFDNISIDLIYAIPGMSRDDWMRNIKKAIALRVAHISAYSLTIEEKTVMGRWAAKGKISIVPDDAAATQLDVLISALENAGFEHYEVSNFAQPGRYSKHNSSYWQQRPYLGIGPSAHSFNIETRQFNIKNNHLYVKALKDGSIPASIERLTREDRINDYLLTTLRTNWGTDLEKLKNDYQYDLETVHLPYLEKLISQSLARLERSHLILTRKGKFLADKISSDLFLLV